MLPDANPFRVVISVLLPLPPPDACIQVAVDDPTYPSWHCTLSISPAVVVSPKFGRPSEVIPSSGRPNKLVTS